ncbi:MAG TPA: hypothetical protein VE010_14120 [Thermoanaerobaculia bacterium]|nr:hypothetical protein [Thermoanaerobaculia bacterium]
MNTLLRALATNRDVPGWEDTATNWLIAAIVTATVVTLAMVFTKLLNKKMAAGPVGLTWNRKQTILFVVAGLLPLAVLIAIVWYSSINFQSIAGVPGLLKGILIGWLFYSASMLVAHASLWRSDLFK